MIQFNEEWKKLQYEIIYNKPQIDSPYPQEVVDKRELLLYAQVELEKAQTSYDNKNNNLCKFHSKLYSLIMKHYYKWISENA